jgi:hypothetical protein
MSPAVVAEYKTQLPDKKLLQAKLHEFYEQAKEQAALPLMDARAPEIPPSMKRGKRPHK